MAGPTIEKSRRPRRVVEGGKMSGNYKTVINPPAMNSVAPPKVEGVRPDRPTRNTSTRNELEKAFRKRSKKW